MAFPPWSILGLDGPADERAIRTAYARLLKTTRPDDDPRAFQALIEARNVALHIARARAAAPLLTIDDEEEADEVQEIESDDFEDASDPAAPHAEPDTLHDFASDPPSAAALEISLAGGAPAKSTEPPPPVEVDLRVEDAEGPLAIELGRSDHADNFARLDPVEPGAEALRIDLGSQPPSGPAAEFDRPPGPQASTPATVRQPSEYRAELRELLSPDTWPPPAEARVEAFLTSFSEQPFEARARLESDVVGIVTTCLPGVLAELSAPSRRAFWRSPQPDAQATAKRQRNLILAIAEIYGWTRSDRRLYELLPRAAATTHAARLRALAKQAAYERERIASPRDGNGIPVFEGDDLTAFFGKEVNFYARYYHKARDLGRWPLEWQWRRFWYGPFWALGLGQYGILTAWLVAFSLTLGGYGRLIECGIGDAVCGLPIAVEWLMFAGALATLVAAHAYIAAYGSRLELIRLARRVRRADRRNLFDPALRVRFLQKGAPEFRVPREKKPPPGMLRRYWWVWWIIIVIAQALARLGHS